MAARTPPSGAAPWVVRRRRLVLVAWSLVAVLFAGAALAGLRLDFSSRAFYTAGADARAFETFLETYGPDDDLLFVLLDADRVAPSRERAVARALAALPEVRAALPPRVLARRLAGTPAARFVVSGDGTRLAMPVRLAEGTDDLGRAVEAVGAVRAVLDDLGLPGAPVAGVPAVRARFFRLALADQARLTPVSFALVGLVASLALGRLRWGLLAVGLAGVALVVEVGSLALLDLPVGLLNQAYFTVLPALSVAETLHLLAAIGAAARPGADAGRAAAEGARRSRRALILAQGTTAIGLASLAVTAVPEVVRFGLGILPGLLAVVLLHATLAPVLVAWWAPRDLLVRCRRGAWVRIGRFAAARPVPVLILAVVTTAVLLVQARRVPVDNRLTDLVPASDPVRVAQAALDRDLGGSLSFSIVVEPAGQAGLDPAALARAERSILEVPGVRAVLGPGTLAAAGGGALDLVLDAAGALGLPPLRGRGGAVRLVVGCVDPGARGFSSLARAAAARVAEALPGVRVRPAGTVYWAYRGVNRVAERLASGIAGALLVIVLVIGASVRRLRDLAAAALANAVPLLGAFAFVGVVRGAVDPLAAVVLALALGVAADDTVHLCIESARHRARGRAARAAMAAALDHSGWAAGWTTLALVAGFSVDAFARFPPLRDLALLGSATLVLALVADLTVLPAVAGLRRRGPPPPPGSGRTEGPPG